MKKYHKDAAFIAFGKNLKKGKKNGGCCSINFIESLIEVLLGQPATTAFVTNLQVLYN